MALAPRGSRRLREFRTSPINGPTRDFVFEVCEAKRSAHGFDSWRTVTSIRLAVTEDPDNPGSLLVAVRGDARVTHDSREVAPPTALPAAPSQANLLALSVAARDSAGRRRCPSCNRGGGLKALPDGGKACRWCAFVVELEAAA